jgi:hypothetical protein
MEKKWQLTDKHGKPIGKPRTEEQKEAVEQHLSKHGHDWIEVEVEVPKGFTPRLVIGGVVR